MRAFLEIDGICESRLFLYTGLLSYVFDNRIIGTTIITMNVALTKGKKAFVDEKDYERVSEFKWHYCNNGYAMRRIHKRVGFKQYKGEYIYMHRFLIGAKRGDIVDHINGDKLDNRKSNLRICTQSENMYNRVKNRSNKWGYKGIYFHADRGKFCARISVSKKKLSLGYYDTALEAAKAYNQAATLYHNKFARLNDV